MKRGAKQYANYKSSGRYSANKKRKITRHLMSHPDDNQARGALKTVRTYARRTPSGQYHTSRFKSLEFNPKLNYYRPMTKKERMKLECIESKLQRMENHERLTLGRTYEYKPDESVVKYLAEQTQMAEIAEYKAEKKRKKKNG